MASEIAPSGFNVHADQQQRVTSSGIALIVLPTCFFILRLISRLIAKAGLWWDDVLVFLALVLSYGPNISMMICKFFRANQSIGYLRLISLSAARSDGFGKHLWVLPEPQYNTRQFLKILYIYIIFYYSAVVAVKFAMYET